MRSGLFILSLCILAGAPRPAAAINPGNSDGPNPAKSAATKPAPKIRPDLVPGYQVKVIEGFTVLLSNETVRNDQSSEDERKPIAVLEHELKTIAGLMPARALKILRNILIWVEWDERVKMSNGREGNPTAIYYGGHQLNLLAQNRHPLKAKNVTILRMKSLTGEHQPRGDSGRCVILHEIAHAVHDQLLGRNNLAVKAAYKQAMERKLYDSNMYAATNEPEFFAELTCSYFDQLQYYPRTRADLHQHDPVTYKLMEQTWGKCKNRLASKSDATSTGDLRVSLETIDLGRPVMGPVITRADLEGRPTMLVLWNAGSRSSLLGLVKVNAWDAELRDFGLVTVGVHLTRARTADLEAVVRARGIGFAITNARWTAKSLVKDYDEFPLCLVFDHAGQCVFRGRPFDAAAPAREVVGKALIAGAGAHSFPRSLAPLVESLRKGWPPSSVLPKLVALTRSRDTETAKVAKALVDKITETGWKGVRQAEVLFKEDPVGAYLQLERFPSVFKDSAVACRAAELLAGLKQDKAVQQELRARARLADVRKLDKDLSSRAGSFDPTGDSFQRDNVILLAHLQRCIGAMKKSWPKSRATEEAISIGTKYGGKE
jgi:hypothetical protein